MNSKKIRKIGAVILAGGLGTRMKSESPKALMPLLENPLIFYAVKSLIAAGEEFNVPKDMMAGMIKKHRVVLDKIGIVIGHKGDLVKDYVSGKTGEKRFKKKGLTLDFAVQEQYLGTGDAARKALDMFRSGAEETDLLIMPSDMPLIKPETFAETVKFHMENGNDLTVLSVETENPYSYGRILRDKEGRPEKIVEEKELCDYPPETAAIKEINSGVYIARLGSFKKYIKDVKPDNRKREYYLTDIVGIFYRAGLKTACYRSSDTEEFAGVNSRYDLMNARKVMQKRIIRDLMEKKGVDFISDENVHIGYNVEIGENCVIYPGVSISGKTFINENVTVETGCVIKDSMILGGSVIKSYSVVENAVIMNGAQIGPFARLRPATFVYEGGRIGNFVEVKNSVIGKNTKASHLSYIGDAIVGDGVNIGAGVITCNYDGLEKHKTVIEDGCFIGSDSQLVAPVNVGRNSYVGSGTTVTKDVPEGALAVSRTPQRNVEGWAAKRRKKNGKKESVEKNTKKRKERRKIKMCGIMGFSGSGRKESSVDIVLNGLKSLEYRGYDSSGIAYYDKGADKIKCVKKSGKLSNLSTEFSCAKPVKSGMAIGHIRWATHGRPTDENAHPHLDCSGNIAIVHNGIIENYSDLRNRLIKKGHRFSTPTDSEVIAHLIEDYVNAGNGFHEAVRLSASELSGAFAVLALNAADKSIAAVKFGPPLVLVDTGKDVYFASDVSPLIEYSNEVIYLKNSEIAYFKGGKLEITNFKGRKISRAATKIDWDASKSVKSGFSHFMQKEIFEQPACLLDAFSSRIMSTAGANSGKSVKSAAVSAAGGKVVKFDKISKADSFSGLKIQLENLKLAKGDLEKASRIVIAACGSSYYAGLAIKYMMETVCGLPVIVEYGSELRYENFPVSRNDIFIGISQSGETADTNSALEIARAARASILSITNVPGSQITTLSNKGVIYTHAGPEIGVASTKAFTTQLLCGLLLALHIREKTGYIPSSKIINGMDVFRDMVELPKKVEQVLLMDDAIKEIAGKYYKSANFLYLGRGILYPIALEGALKLKEISYIHAEGYPAGEMKHGPIALVDENMPVLFLLSNNMLAPKTISNIEEIKARGGRIIAVADYEPEMDGLSDLIKIPAVSDVLSPVLYTVPLQLLAYHIAALKGTDIDQPRNLAKSVTVEKNRSRG